MNQEMKLDRCMYHEAVPEAHHLEDPVILGSFNGAAHPYESTFGGRNGIKAKSKTKTYAESLEKTSEIKKSLNMVGMGEPCENSNQFRVGACVKCGYEIVLPMTSCGHTECPRCMKTWARRASERSGARVWGAVTAVASKYYPQHISFELSSLSWKEAKKKAASLGATGGVLVLHAHRIKKEYAKMYEITAARCSCSRYDVARQAAFGTDALEFSPHAHGIVYGRLVDVEKGSGVYLYRNLRRLNSQSAVERTLAYILNHTVQLESKRQKSVRYFGICSPQKLKPSWTGECNTNLFCPCCNGIMVEKDTMDEILVRRYISLGWHTVIRLPGVTGGKHPPVAPLDRIWGSELPPGLCTSSEI